MLIFVTIHELAHIFAAKLIFLRESKKFRLKQFIITPLGETAIIENIERISGNGRASIYLAGPLSNLIISLIFVENRSSIFFLGNLALFLINMLPAFPFDGGNLCQLFLGNIFGVMKGNRFLVFITNLLGFIMMFLGAAQIALFPYNGSLLCLGIFLYKNCKNQIARNMVDFYRYEILDKVKFHYRKELKQRKLLVSKNMGSYEVFKKLTYDYIHEIYISDMDVSLKEEQFCEIVGKTGLNGTIGGVYEAANFPT